MTHPPKPASVPEENRMKSVKHSPWFDKWLELMEQAYEVLTAEAFVKLEDRIIHEIRYHRKKQV